MYNCRYQELMNNESSLHPEELRDGWHFCPEWDGLLISPESPEAAACTCLGEYCYETLKFGGDFLALSDEMAIETKPDEAIIVYRDENELVWEREFQAYWNIGAEVTFADDPHPFIVMAIGSRHAILIRDIQPEDTTSREGYEYVYTIVDSVEWVRGPTNLVFDYHDFRNRDDRQDCLDKLEIGEISLSHRYSIPVE